MHTEVWEYTLHLVDTRNDNTTSYIKKIKTWADRVRTSSLRGRERMTAYDAYLEKFILHIVSSTNFTLKQCRELAKLISPILLHAHSIQQNCACIVLYSTLNNTGLNVTHIYHLQGLEKLRFFWHTSNDMTLQATSWWFRYFTPKWNSVYPKSFSIYNIMITKSF